MFSVSSTDVEETDLRTVESLTLSLLYILLLKETPLSLLKENALSESFSVSLELFLGESSDGVAHKFHIL